MSTILRTTGQRGSGRLAVRFICVLGCCTWRAAAGDIEVSVADQAGKAVADAVVQVAPVQVGAESSARRSAPAHAVIAQIEREFVPYVSVIRVGTEVAFPNRDPMRHHVYSFSRAKRFEIKLYQGEAPRSVVFDKAGVVTLGCNVHDWMLAYIYVTDAPHFGQTDASGKLRLQGLAPGGYRVSVWHPTQRAGAAAQSVALGDAAWLRFKLDVAPRKARYKPPLDPTQYR